MSYVEKEREACLCPEEQAFRDQSDQALGAMAELVKAAGKAALEGKARLGFQLLSDASVHGREAIVFATKATEARAAYLARESL